MVEKKSRVVKHSDAEVTELGPVIMRDFLRGPVEVTSVKNLGEAPEIGRSEFHREIRVVLEGRGMVSFGESESSQEVVSAGDVFSVKPGDTFRLSGQLTTLSLRIPVSETLESE